MADTVYTINLGKVWRKPRKKRRNSAINLIREYIMRHMKTEDVNISAELNNIIFSGLPRKVKVRTKKEGEKAFVTLSTAKFMEKKAPAKEEKKPEEKKEEEEKKTPEEIELEKKEKEAREVQDKAAVLEG
jgi:large subunit ribosomal protein L31e